MKLHCPDCGHLVPSADVNVQAMVAKCKRCDAVFSFANAVRGRAAADSFDSSAATHAISPLQAKISRLRREVAAYGLATWLAGPVYMRVLWRLDLDVPPSLLWPPAVYGVVSGLLYWATVTALGAFRSPSTHGWLTPSIVVIGIIAAVRQRGRLGSYSFSPWYGTSETTGC